MKNDVRHLSQGPIGHVRYRILSLIFFATTINYLDRQVLGLLKPILGRDLHWTEIDYSHIVMAFSISYALGLSFAGGIIDRLGTKIGYSLSLIIWSLASMAHALASSTLGFGFCRSLLGLGESGNFPAAIKSVTEWFPKKERALATGIFNSGTNIGAMLGPILIPWILGLYGWRAAFFLTGVLGFIWWIFWWRIYQIPGKKRDLSEEEFRFIHQDDSESPSYHLGMEKEESRSLGTKSMVLLKTRAIWGFILGKFLTDPIWYFFLFWLPSYFSSTFKLDFTKPSIPLVIVFSATSLGSIGGGYLSSALIQRGWEVYKARRFSMFLFAILVMPIFFAQYTHQLWLVVLLLSLAASAHQAWSANIYTTASDIFPKESISTVISLGAMAGSIGGIFFPIFIGEILESAKKSGNITTGYNFLFSICSIAYIIAWVLMQVLNSRSRKMNKVEIN